MGCSVPCSLPPVLPRSLSSSVAQRRRWLFKPLRCGYGSRPYQLASPAPRPPPPQAREKHVHLPFGETSVLLRSSPNCRGGWNKARILLFPLFLQPPPPAALPAPPSCPQGELTEAREGLRTMVLEGTEPRLGGPRAKMISSWAYHSGPEPAMSSPWASTFPSVNGDNERESIADG